MAGLPGCLVSTDCSSLSSPFTPNGEVDDSLRHLPGPRWARFVHGEEVCAGGGCLPHVPTLQYLCHMEYLHSLPHGQAFLQYWRLKSTTVAHAGTTVTSRKRK